MELLFDEVTRFNLVPSEEDYESIIQAATLCVRAPDIYWADVPEWRPELPGRDGATWIAARRLRWRDVSSWMGDALRYGPGLSAPP